MKTFEEEFPSLKGKFCNEALDGYTEFIVQKYCLDKTRVNKVLWNNLKNVKGMVYETILEELGLE